MKTETITDAEKAEFTDALKLIRAHIVRLPIGNRFKCASDNFRLHIAMQAIARMARKNGLEL